MSSTKLEMPAPPVARAEVVVEPARKGGLRNMVIGLGIVGALAFVGTGIVVSNGNDTVSSGGTTVESTTPEQAAAQSVPVMEDGLTELQAAADSAAIGDVAGTITHTNNAAASWDAVSDIWDGVDPYISSTSAEVASHLYAAAADVEAGDYQGAANELDAGSALISDMTSYLDSTYLGTTSVISG